MNFDESVSYLYSLGNEVTAMKLGLENPRKLLQALDNQHEKYLKVQIAGTNGKGSTCAFLDSICRQAKIKTGLFTSPHLISITERIKINGNEISDSEFAKYATKVRKITESENLYATFFEQITAIALLAFAENNVELAILETGLGGRLDATTAANAEIVAITPIDYDHQQYLGETLTEIAGEKAAIINSPNQKVVVSKQNAESEKVILERCKEFGISPISDSKFQISDLKLSLLGKHQIENAKVAICLAEMLKIDKSHIINGLQTAAHKGRLEFYENILFDGSHNVAGAKSLREYLEEYISQPITLIFGAMKDKQIAEIAEILFPLAEDLILTQPNNSRSATIEELEEIALKIVDKNKIFVVPNVEDAVNSARQIAETYPATKGSLICVTGSLYLVGEVQKILDNNV
jgi:dihydrofolate synthase / folylpolyglutamate synthase